MPGETTLKEQEEAKGEAGVRSEPVMAASQGVTLESSRNPNSFFDQFVKPLQHTAEESPDQQAQALLVREAQEKREAEEAATLSWFNEQIAAGLKQAQRGEFVGDIDQVLDQIDDQLDREDAEQP